MYNLSNAFSISSVSKRDGCLEKFDSRKINSAVTKAFKSVGVSCSTFESDLILANCLRYLEDLQIREVVDIEDLHNSVIKSLNKLNYPEIANAYSLYRLERDKVRELKSDLMKSVKKIGKETDRDNANVGNNFSSKLLRISSETNKWQNLATMPKDLAREHEIGNLYYHDLDSYNLTTNCLHLPTGKLLSTGFNTGYGTLKPPKRIETAAELSCIMLQSSQNDMFGGQSHPDFDNDMSEYVWLTRQEIVKDLLDNAKALGVEIDEYSDKFRNRVENILVNRVHQAMQGVVYNLNTMHSRAGSQVPFSSINLGIPNDKDAALVCKAFLEEYEKGLGKGEQPIFPNIIFRVKRGVNANPDDPYYYLFDLACRVAAKRMNPTFMNIDADFNKEYYDKGYMPATMGCRTYLMKNVNGEPGCAGRGNIAPVTINLPRIGIQAHGDLVKFFKLFEERIDRARESLLHRYSVLKELRVKDLPFVVGQGIIVGSEGLEPNDSIEPILKQGTWGIGFIGLAETLVALTGKHHGEDRNSRELGEKIVRFLRNKCDEFCDKDKLNWSCYATPAEGLSGKFIAQDKKLFGEIEGVTDKDYYTNSFHIPVGYKISMIDKINIEAPYHKMCNGGHISYIEVDSNPDKEVIKSIVTYAYNNTNISYIGVNFHMRYCKDCGTQLDMSNQVCPKCSSSNIQGVSRVTGYLSLDERFGVGKSAERADRITHQEDHRSNY